MRNTILIIQLCLAAVLFSLPGITVADELTTGEVIAKAREYLGGDEKLESISTILYKGVFESPISGNSGYISILLKKPLMQRMEVLNGSVTEITAINDFEGWKRSVDNTNPNDWSFVILNLSELKRMRANTWENLNFFTGIEHLMGRVINKGPTHKDGRKAYLLIFEYDKGLYYERYFDIETGELISTINNNGVEIKEVGEIMVDGVRFPEKVITLVDGEVANIVTFVDVLLNEEMDESLFDVPSMYPGSLLPVRESEAADSEEQRLEDESEEAMP